MRHFRERKCHPASGVGSLFRGSAMGVLHVVEILQQCTPDVGWSDWYYNTLQF